MNLQTIQKRIEELSAELITISNDLAFLIQGEVLRQPVGVVGVPVTRFTQLREGDTIHIPHAFVDIDNDNFSAGEYKVESVERADYNGHWNVEIATGSDATWLNFATLHSVTKGA